MPKYVKNGREIFASEKAFKLFYEDQGYQPVTEKAPTPADPEDHVDDESADLETNTEDTKTNAPTGAPADPEDLPDDFGEDEDAEEDNNEIDLSVDGNTPLAARVALMPYDKLKEKAKELGIPKYSQTKFETLVTLVTEAIEKSNAN